MPIHKLDNLAKTNKQRILLICQVQSGKTKKIIELISSYSSSRDIAIVFGGTTNVLTEQTFKRFKSDLLSDTKEIRIFSLDKVNNIWLYTSNKNSFFPVLVVIKGKMSLQLIENLLETDDLWNKRILLIDDESDYASVNNSRHEDKRSAISEIIEKIYEKSKICIFFQVTATPFANILSSAKYDDIQMLMPNDEYTGSKFFLNKKNFYKLIDADKSKRETWKESIDLSLATWLVSTANYILNTNSEIKSEFLINIDLKTPSHDEIRKLIYKRVSLYKRYPDKINNFIEKALNDLTINESIKANIFNKIPTIVQTISKDNSIVVLNSTDDSSIYQSGMFRFAIIIGGNVISRGITFKYLVTQLMLNSPNEDRVIDTLLQRARWFGYRHEHDEIQKYMNVFLNQNILDVYKAVDSTIDFLEKNYKDKDLKNKFSNFIETELSTSWPGIKITNKPLKK
ncbi:MAG: Z1 domain-containing protein [Mycoplasmataceae bacterium]|nr:Z1 domain-containing protein [Mycoplasmataceae bacterium]